MVDRHHPVIKNENHNVANLHITYLSAKGASHSYNNL